MASREEMQAETERLTANAQAMDQFNQGVISEFRANQGKVGGQMAGIPLLLLTMKGAKTGRTLTRPLAFTRDGDRIRNHRLVCGLAEKSALVSQPCREPDGYG